MVNTKTVFLRMLDTLTVERYARPQGHVNLRRWRLSAWECRNDTAEDGLNGFWTHGNTTVAVTVEQESARNSPAICIVATLSSVLFEVLYNSLSVCPRCPGKRRLLHPVLSFAGCSVPGILESVPSTGCAAANSETTTETQPLHSYTN